MNKTLRYTIVGISALAGGYIAYLIYNKLHIAIIDAKVTPYKDAIKTLDNI
jgi:putative flippase GtrA